MKPQIIEAADGTQWEKVDNDNGIVPKEPGVFRHFIFKRLLPPNPMPNLKVGYLLAVGVHPSPYHVIVRPYFSGDKVSVFYIPESDLPIIEIPIKDITEIHCPSRGLIWSKEK